MIRLDPAKFTLIADRPVPVIIDTDAGCEIDDQFAIVYALLSSENIEIRGITAAPFFNPSLNAPREGMEYADANNGTIPVVYNLNGGGTKIVYAMYFLTGYNYGGYDFQNVRYIPTTVVECPVENSENSRSKLQTQGKCDNGTYGLRANNLPSSFYGRKITEWFDTSSVDGVNSYMIRTGKIYRPADWYVSADSWSINMKRQACALKLKDSSSSGSDGALWMVHGNRANMQFGDGHVESVAPGDSKLEENGFQVYYDESKNVVLI